MNLNVGLDGVTEHQRRWSQQQHHQQDSSYTLLHPHLGRFSGGARCQSGQVASRWTKASRLGFLAARAWHQHKEHGGEAQWWRAAKERAFTDGGRMSLVWSKVDSGGGGDVGESWGKTTAWQQGLATWKESPNGGAMSHPSSRKQNRSLHTCA
jgi:hypothetical protein